jgi:hypothetical protein
MSCYLTILTAQLWHGYHTPGFRGSFISKNVGTIGLNARCTFVRMALDKFQKVS